MNEWALFSCPQGSMLGPGRYNLDQDWVARASAASRDRQKA